MKCRKCGFETGENDNFCQNCGNSLKTPTKKASGITQDNQTAHETPKTIKVLSGFQNQQRSFQVSLSNKNKKLYMILLICGVIIIGGLVIKFNMLNKISYEKDTISEQEARDFVEKWKNSWVTGIESGNMSYYRSLYDPEELQVPYKNKNYNEYMVEQQEEASNTNLVFIDVSDITVQKDKNDNRIKVEFNQDYLSNLQGYTGKKTLILSKKDGQIRIALEDFVETPVPKLITHSQLLEYIERWRVAWEATCFQKTISFYKRFYSPDFYSYYKGTNYAQYMKERKGIGERATVLSITVDPKSLTFGTLKERAITSFKQTYQSDKYGDYGIKTLVLSLRGGMWLITREEFKRIKKLRPLELEVLEE